MDFLQSCSLHRSDFFFSPHRFVQNLRLPQSPSVFIPHLLWFPHRPSQPSFTKDRTQLGQVLNWRVLRSHRYLNLLRVALSLKYDLGTLHSHSRFLGCALSNLRSAFLGGGVYEVFSRFLPNPIQHLARTGYRKYPSHCSGLPVLALLGRKTRRATTLDVRTFCWTRKCLLSLLFFWD